MNTLEIIAQSWPIAVMFLGTVIGCVVLYIVRWWKQSDREDKAYRASQALIVRDRNRDEG